MATRIYKTPFAATGDKEALATADQPDGKVSLQAGWTPDYELANDNPNYRPVGRGEMNGVLYEVTAALGELQTSGFALWQSIDGGWPLDAIVKHSGVIYRSTEDANISVPGDPGATWEVSFAELPATQCRLILSGGALLLAPFGGKALYINGKNRAIPSAGVSLAATGLAVGTTYYIYALWTGSAIALEASTTGHSADSSTGVEIKTGDATRTLVGMARTVTGPAWKDDYDQRFVLSWYNRQAKVARKQLTGAVTLTAGPSGIDALKTEFICWSNGVPSAAMTGGCQVGTGATYAFRLGLNGSDIPNWLWTACLTSSEAVVPIALTELAPSIAEGYNFITLAYTRGTGSTTGTVTGTFNGNTNVQVQIQG